jgi:TRAP transporter TAXI family solute receptor
MMLVAELIFDASPPGRIRMATGQPGGMYDAFGAQYRERLGRVGLEVQIHQSNGATDNLGRLVRREVDVAFVQGGTARFVRGAEERVRGMAAVYLEPLWVFYRRGARVDSIADLAEKRISVGLAGSGTEAVASALLREHQIDLTSPNILRLGNAEAKTQLENGALHVALFVTSYQNPLIVDLLARPDLELLSFRREAAYSRIFPELRPVTLPEGLLDLRRNLPGRDKSLLAPAALLACREDIHPRVVEQVLKVARDVHGPGSRMDAPNHFPTLEGVDLPVHHAAEIYLTHGESFLSRSLPYPLLRWTLLLRLLVLPAILIWLPIFRVLPAIATWRVDRRVARLYSALLSAEREIIAADGPEILRHRLARLDRLLVDAEALCRSIPGARQRDVYHWRFHVGLVRTEGEVRLARLLVETPESNRIH